MKEKDPYQILKIEFLGVKKVIDDYTSKGTIINYLNVLEKSLAENNAPQVLYALEGVCDWYNENLPEIFSNEWVFNKDEHRKVKALLDRLLSELTDYDFSKIKEVEKSRKTSGNKIFIVHGHDEEAKITVARTLEKLGLDAVILHEQPDKGKTIIEKLETYTAEAAYAIVLYTECDVGRAKEKTEADNQFRARQNVVFEHGLFIGSLGRENVSALVKGNVEKPGDIDGVVYITMDEKGAWKMDLCRNMKAAGLDIDFNKLL